ncbi:hypothetical protein F2Q70_00029094 [Brassica cretica]|uniref:Uncharacterized protein n=1 Tax=Brassica cretica TaxID=69181 RepID=A0A8S9FFF5_BRACR|nr:hypothetical protein F2Q70_00029094 [Brassica cretica]
MKQPKLISNTKPDITACLGALYTWDRILQTGLEAPDTCLKSLHHVIDTPKAWPEPVDRCPQLTIGRRRCMPSGTTSNKEKNLLFSDDPAHLERTIRRGQRSTSLDAATSSSIDTQNQPSTDTRPSSSIDPNRSTTIDITPRAAQPVDEDARSKPLADYNHLDECMPSGTRSNKEKDLLFSDDPAHLERTIHKGQRSTSLDATTSSSIDTHNQPLTDTRPSSSIDPNCSTTIDTTPQEYDEDYWKERAIEMSLQDERFETHKFTNTFPTSFDEVHSTSVDTHPRPAKQPLTSIDTHTEPSIDIRSAAKIQE